MHPDPDFFIRYRERRFLLPRLLFDRLSKFIMVNEFVQYVHRRQDALMRWEDPPLHFLL
jgi:hypothetical protein